MFKFQFFLFDTSKLRQVDELVRRSTCMSQYLTVAAINTVGFFKEDTMQLDMAISDKYKPKLNNKKLLKRLFPF